MPTLQLLLRVWETLVINLLVVGCLENKISTSQLSQAINSPSVPTAVGKCKISIEKNREKIEKIYLFIFIY